MKKQLDENHYAEVIRAIKGGQVVPFLGAGVNLFRRKEITGWQPGQRLPSGAELAQYLAEYYNYPSPDRRNLLRVSQYAAIKSGTGPLYDSPSEVFNAEYEITYLHRFFAKLPGWLKAMGSRRCHQLIVTTNYDNVLEKAFYEQKEPYDLVIYIAKEPNLGKFWHIPYRDDQSPPADGVSPPQGAILIEDPNAYNGLPFDKAFNPLRTVILKIHGAVDRVTDRASASPDQIMDSFVITEDDYIDYLAYTDVSRLMPVQVNAKLMNSGFLFLGYGLRDWNLRVILRRIWREQYLSYRCWAVQKDVDELDEMFWQKHFVTIIEARLEKYMVQLCKRLRKSAGARGVG
jgi:hypothetical protein